MVVNVMDPDRVFKGAEFNLLLPMKGRGRGKCRIGGMNTGGLLPVLPMHFCSQLGAFCMLTAENLSTSPLLSWDAAASPECLSPVMLFVAAGEGAVAFCSRSTHACVVVADFGCLWFDCVKTL